MTTTEKIQAASIYVGMIWVFANILFWETMLDKHPCKWWWYMKDKTLTIAFFTEIGLIIGLPFLIYFMNH